MSSVPFRGSVIKRQILTKQYSNLAPGGWLEVPDITFPMSCDDDTFGDDTPLKHWSDHMLKASYNLQRPLDSAKSYAKQMAEVGFVNVTEKMYKWPTNGWPKDPKHKELGRVICLLSSVWIRKLIISRALEL